MRLQSGTPGTNRDSQQGKGSYSRCRLGCWTDWQAAVPPAMEGCCLSSRSKCMRLESQCVMLELTDTYVTPSGRTRLVLRVAPQGHCYAHTLSLTHTPTRSLCFLPVRFASLSLSMNWRSPQGSEQMRTPRTGALKTMNLTSIFEPNLYTQKFTCFCLLSKGIKGMCPMLGLTNILIGS